MSGTLNPVSVEAMTASTGLETYLDCIENLPTAIQEQITYLHELDLRNTELKNEIMKFHDSYEKEKDAAQRKLFLSNLKNLLIKSQKIGDLKLNIVAKILEMSDSSVRQLDQDFRSIEPSGPGVPVIKEEEPQASASMAPSVAVAEAPQLGPGPTASSSSSSTTRTPKVEDKEEILKGSKRPRQHRRHQDSISKEEKKEEEKPRKKKAKREKGNERLENDKTAVATDEQIYCLCQRVSFGEMICCDNGFCAIQWFHFSCVNIEHTPKGKWFCPKCRGDRSNVMSAEWLDYNRREKEKEKQNKKNSE